MPLPTARIDDAAHALELVRGGMSVDVLAEALVAAGRFEHRAAAKRFATKLARVLEI